MDIEKETAISQNEKSILRSVVAKSDYHFCAWIIENGKLIVFDGMKKFRKGISIQSI